MIVAERTEALDKLANIAALAGIEMDVNRRAMRLEGVFVLSDGRTQMVHARPSGMAGDKFVVTLISPCVRVKKGLLGGLSKDTAIELLRRNEGLLFARFGLVEEEDAYVVVASADYLLDTLDAEEFEHAIWHVAMAADACEKDLGKGRDDF